MPHTQIHRPVKAGTTWLCLSWELRFCMDRNVFVALLSTPQRSLRIRSSLANCPSLPGYLCAASCSPYFPKFPVYSFLFQRCRDRYGISICFRFRIFARITNACPGSYEFTAACMRNRLLVWQRKVSLAFDAGPWIYLFGSVLGFPILSSFGFEVNSTYEIYSIGIGLFRRMIPPDFWKIYEHVS